MQEMGIQGRRVRQHGGLACIEMPKEWIAVPAEPEDAARLDAQFRCWGFQSVSYDLRGFRSSALSEVIPFVTERLRTITPATGAPVAAVLALVARPLVATLLQHRKPSAQDAKRVAGVPAK